MSNFYNQAKFEISVAAIKQLPPEQGYEVAFAGRSNAGKSSAINALTGHRNLARTSKTPGRTQLLNFFRMDEQRALVDLPGYGYAKVPESIKRQWHDLIDSYLSNRQILSGIVLIMDSRHPFGRLDQQIIDWQWPDPYRYMCYSAKLTSWGKASALTPCARYARN